VGDPAVINGAITAGFIDLVACDATQYTENGSAPKGYGIHDVRTDAIGDVTFYLPATGNSDADKEVVTLKSGGVTYGAKFVRGNVGNTAATLIDSLPILANLTPAHGVRAPLSGDVVLTFDTDMNRDVAGTVTLTPNGAVPITLTGGSWTGNRVYTLPYKDLSYSVTYMVTVSNFENDRGAPMAQDDSHSFTTKVKQETPTAELFSYTMPANLTYDGAQKAAAVGVKSDVNGLGAYTVYYTSADDGGAAYAKSPIAPTDAGTYTVSVDVVANDNYARISDLVIGTLSIAQRNIVNATITLDDMGPFVYTGDAFKPTVANVVVGGSSVSTLSGATSVNALAVGIIVPPSAYTVSYSANIMPGTAAVTVKAKPGENFTGSASTTFEINSASTATLLRIAAQTKTGDNMPIGWLSGAAILSFLIAVCLVILRRRHADKQR
jgi:hypothetical protein